MNWTKKRIDGLSNRGIRALIGVGVLAAVVILLWVPFGFRHAPLYEEWIFARVHHFERPVWFIDADSPLNPFQVRPLMLWPNALAETLTPGSFSGLYFLAMIFFWLKGVTGYLVFQSLFRRLTDHADLYGLFAAILLIIYPADSGLFALRGIQTHVALIFLLGAIAGVLHTVQHPKRWHWAIIWAALSVSLLMYETGYPVVALTPLLMIWSSGRPVWKPTRLLIAQIGLWFIPPISCGIRALIITRSGAASYLSDVSSDPVGANGTVSLGDLINTLLFVIGRLFIGGWNEAIRGATQGGYGVFTLGVIGVIGVVGLAALWTRREGERGNSIRTPLLLTGIGVLIGVGGFAAFLPVRILHYTTERTYVLASAGAVLTLMGLLLTITTLFFRYRPNWRQIIHLVNGVVLIVLCGLGWHHAVQQHAAYIRLAGLQERVFGQMVAIAPRLKDRAFVVIVDETGLLKGNWFSGAEANLSNPLRYVYNNNTLAGTVCYAERAYIFNIGQCVFKRDLLYINGAIPVGGTFGDDKQYGWAGVVIFVFSPNFQLTLLERFPPNYQAEFPLIEDYRPGLLIHTDQVVNRSATLFPCFPVEPCTASLHTQRSAYFTDLDPQAEHWRPGFGWHDSDQGAMWTGAYRTTALTWLADRNYQLRFSVVDRALPDGELNLQVEVNHIKVALTRTNTLNGAIYTATLPNWVIAASPYYTEISFLTDRLKPESDQPKLQLGVRVDWIRVEPLE
jgi:hypothetical protein